MITKGFRGFFLSLGIAFFALFNFGGCATAGTTTTVQTSNQNVNEVAAYSGPKARIAVAVFKCKAAKCSGQIGSGIKDMLVDALFRTNRFIVLERGEGFSELQKELEMVRGKDFNQAQTPKGGHLEGADILVVGAITAFEPNAEGIGGGIGGLVGGFFGVKASSKEAYIAANIRLIDVRTGRVINSTRVEGKASSFSIGGIGGGLVGNVALAGGLSMYKNTPMEKAVMVMIDRATQEISRLVPDSYYRVK